MDIHTFLDAFPEVISASENCLNVKGHNYALQEQVYIGRRNYY